MRRHRVSPKPLFWNRQTGRLLRWIDTDRADELRTHIDDATTAGVPLRAADAASVVGLVTRLQAARARQQIPLVIAGLPVLLLCTVASGLIYETHFAPWDLMEDVPSTNPTVAVLRRAVDHAWLVLLPLGLLSGWRVARSVRQGRLRLPAAYLLGLVILMSQADLFIEHTAWFADGQLRPHHVDSVSPYSIGLLAVSLTLPVVFLTLDAIGRRRHHRSAPIGQITRQEPEPESGSDLLAIGAIVAPALTFAIQLPALALFFLLSWLAPSFRLRHKLTATLALGLPVGAAFVFAGDEGIDDPGLGALGFLLFFLATWAWLASVALRQPVNSADGFGVDPMAQ